ncbi:hypothetical protein A0O34_10260 [Chryseobacterium glaciei]|uniref:Uncharacterized protein n=1 Tax=Chryseobacterium glaciei TaxID=1685010 RepID=A0A172XV31_9FLAO|nr:hypothetical protein [Chryseobacterium glaciei]ANF50877.1 hypothetical protein A0O34_10260 [Chryseobacterium glaciei]
MGRIKGMLFLMLIFCVKNLSAQSTVLKPDKVFGLYFDTFVKHDENALNNLNTYLKNFVGEDGIYKNNTETAYTEELKGLTNLFLSGFSENIREECREDAKNYFAALFDRYKTATYTIKSMETMRNDYSQSQDISEVFYDVMIKVPAKVTIIDLKKIKKISAKELKGYLKSLTNELVNADKEISLSEKFNLYQIYKGSDVFYWNGGPQELLWKVNNFYFKNINSGK